MAVTSAPAREKRARSARKRKGKKKSGWFAVWWPLIAGAVATPFAIHAASILALAGPGALTTLYPWVLLLKIPAIGPGGGLGDNLSQLLMYIQFPLYGLLMVLLLRSKPVWTALGLTAAVHVSAVLAAFLFAGHSA